MSKDRSLLSFGPYYPVVVTAVLCILFLAGCRIGLMLMVSERIYGIGPVARILVSGLRMDIVLMVYLLGLPAVLAPVFEGGRYTGAAWRWFLIVWLSGCLVFVVFMEAVTPTFIHEYDVRPNRLFLEYLIYPKEIISMLVSGYSLTLAVVAGIVIAAACSGIRMFSKVTGTPSEWSVKRRVFTWPLVVLALIAGGRSSLGHRGVTPSNVAFSTDALLNDFPLSSAYSVLYAAYRMKDEANAFKLYGSMDSETIISLVRQSSGISSRQDPPDQLSTLNFHDAVTPREKPYNLVIILEESMGAEFVQSLGGLPLTPNLEKLSAQGLWFDRLYATGTRSVRGIEAVVSGFLPTPGRSVVKLGKSQNGFFTIAELLAARGYHTQFIYGGDSNFDNMKGFFLGNGFKEVIDQKDYSAPGFVSTWGVSDEDLFAMAHSCFTRQADSSFFSLVFTSSNHTPFEFPDRPDFDLYETPKNTVKNAVKYADYALGRFFDMAQQSNYWHNTVFLVVADHHAKVFGQALVPVKKFRIPGLIIGPGVTPGVYTEIASQIDLPPTLLSLMGISSWNPMPGRDLATKSPALPGRAIMQFYKNQAYMEGDQMVVLEPGKKRGFFKVKDEHLSSGVEHHLLAEKALAHALWASLVYQEKLFRLHPAD